MTIKLIKSARPLPRCEPDPQARHVAVTARPATSPACPQTLPAVSSIAISAQYCPVPCRSQIGEALVFFLFDLSSHWTFGNADTRSDSLTRLKGDHGMDTQIPSRTALKSQAKRLRASLGTQGKTISHGQSLEMIAQQYGHHDWNTINAIAPEDMRSN